MSNHTPIINLVDDGMIIFKMGEWLLWVGIRTATHLTVAGSIDRLGIDKNAKQGNCLYRMLQV